jgi:Icc-related predicted phosphoesterase
MMTFQQVILVGDLHGRLEVVDQLIDRFGIRQTALIQVGDLGMGFHDYLNPEVEWEWLTPLNERLRKTRNKLFVVRGNHDNPAFWNGQQRLSNIRLVQDFTTLWINRLSFVFIGGGVSVDRSMRTEGKNWWRNERFPYNDPMTDTISKVDVLITHIAPIFSPPLPRESSYDKYPMSDVAKAWADSMKERYGVAEMYHRMRVKPTLWVHGHYHYSSFFTNDTTKIIGVGEYQSMSLDQVWDGKI